MSHVIGCVLCCQTNVPFHVNCLRHLSFVSGSVDTYFIEENPDLISYIPPRDRAQKLLHYLGNVMVNGPLTPLGTKELPATLTPSVPEVDMGKYRYGQGWINGQVVK